ncbi:MAG: peptide ABC transporter substrate-binding protein [Moraxellaceae bacterium]|nr:peptide ABC transporter substrate-binding protein [Moraxellaceae bacterium]
MKFINKLTASIFIISFGLMSVAQAKNIKNSSNDKKIKSIRIANGDEPYSLDPHQLTKVSENNIIRQIFEGLTTYDSNGNTIGGMASHWQTKDNKTWIFYLRNAKWSNGKPVTADDFVYSFRRLINPDSASAYAIYLAEANIVNAKAILYEELPVEKLGVKALDSKTLQITLNKPTPALPSILTYIITSPVYPPVVEKYGNKWTNPSNIVVNGAYTLDEWKINDYIKLKRNSLYYNNKNTKIDTAIFLPLNEGDENLYDEGKVDLFENANFVNSNAPNSEKKIAPEFCSYYYEFNLQKPPFNDVRVRKALAYTIDLKKITDNIPQKPTHAYQLTPTTINTYTKDKLIYLPKWQKLTKAERIAKAQKLLKQAGYTKDNPLQFKLLYNNIESHKKIAENIVSMWQNNLHNIKITLVPKTWRNYLEARKEGDYQVTRAGWCGDYNEPSTFLEVFKSNHRGNYSGYNSKNYNHIMQKTLSANITPKQRLDLYRQAEAQLDKDMPIIKIYHYSKPLLIKPYVKDYPFNNPTNEWKIKNMNIDKK